MYIIYKTSFYPLIIYITIYICQGHRGARANVMMGQILGKSNRH